MNLGKLSNKRSSASAKYCLHLLALLICLPCGVVHSACLILSHSLGAALLRWGLAVSACASWSGPTPWLRHLPPLHPRLPNDKQGLKVSDFSWWCPCAVAGFCAAFSQLTLGVLAQCPPRPAMRPFTDLLVPVSAVCLSASSQFPTEKMMLHG